MGRKKSRKTKQKSGLQKRYVSSLRMYVSDEEKEEILSKVGNFSSVSNYLRHHFGLPPNETGRKKIHTAAAFDLGLDESVDESSVKNEFEEKAISDKDVFSGQVDEMFDNIMLV